MTYLKKGLTTSPEDKNIELLAWLIDYESRPHKFKWENDPPKPPGPGDSTPVEPPNDDPLPPPPVRVLPTRKVILIGVLLFLIGASVYWISRGPSESMHCMYWVEDHYEPISCSKEAETMTALDPGVLENFKKITRPDTITPASIGKVYYLRRHGGHEFYTQKGDVPDDPTLRLLPLTPFIYTNHILPLKK